MAQRETRLASPLRSALERARVRVTKLHGNKFQAGLPDWLLEGPRRYGLAEVKVWPRSSSPTALEGLAFCTGLQRRWLMRAWVKGHPAWLVLVSESKGVVVIRGDRMGVEDETRWLSLEEAVAVIKEGLR